MRKPNSKELATALEQLKANSIFVVKDILLLFERYTQRAREAEMKYDSWNKHTQQKYMHVMRSLEELNKLAGTPAAIPVKKDLRRISDEIWRQISGVR